MRDVSLGRCGKFVVLSNRMMPGAVPLRGPPGQGGPRGGGGGGGAAMRGPMGRGDYGKIW